MSASIRTSRMIAFVHLWMTTVMLLGTTGPADGAVVRIRASATAAGAVVRLRDVADVQDVDPAVVERLHEITLAPAPSPGGQLKLDFATVRSRLEAQGVNLASIEFTGQSMVTVVGGPRDAVARDENPGTARSAAWQQQRAEKLLTEAIRQHVRREAPDLGQMTVVLRLEPGHVPAVLAADGESFQVQGGGPDWDGLQTMRVRFVDQKGQSQELELNCRITPHPFVLAVRHTLPAGHVLQETDLVWRQVNDPAEALTRLEDAVGRETHRTVRKDEIVRAHDIRQIPLVRSNDIVTVYSRRPGITVRRQLKARSEGAAGETVTLVTLDGRQSVLARVTGYHEAEVVSSGQ